MGVMSLTRKEWRKFKKENNLERSAVLKKADVGPSIVKFQKAVSLCEDAPGKKSLEECLLKASNLEKAFEKFIKLKKGEVQLSKSAENRIEEWKSELGKVVAGLAKLHKTAGKELDDADAKNMDKTFDKLGIYDL